MTEKPCQPINAYNKRHVNAVYSCHYSVISLLDDIPFRIVPNITGLTRQRDWEERALNGAMQKLGVKHGYLVGPVNKAELPPKSGGIGILPWTAWS